MQALDKAFPLCYFQNLWIDNWHKSKCYKLSGQIEQLWITKKPQRAYTLHHIYPASEQCKWLLPASHRTRTRETHKHKHKQTSGKSAIFCLQIDHKLVLLLTTTVQKKDFILNEALNFQGGFIRSQLSLLGDE